MFFSTTPDVVASWWASNLAGGVPLVQEGEFWYFLLNGVEFGFHPADPIRNPIGGSPVVYLSTADLENTRESLLILGCSMHRGPLIVDDSRRICQMIDPFGNTFGLDGP